MFELMDQLGAAQGVMGGGGDRPGLQYTQRGGDQINADGGVKTHAITGLQSSRQQKT